MHVFVCLCLHVFLQSLWSPSWTKGRTGPPRWNSCWWRPRRTFPMPRNRSVSRVCVCFVANCLIKYQLETHGRCYWNSIFSISYDVVWHCYVCIHSKFHFDLVCVCVQESSLLVLQASLRGELEAHQQQLESSKVRFHSVCASFT